MQSQWKAQWKELERRALEATSLAEAQRLSIQAERLHARSSGSRWSWQRGRAMIPILRN